MQIKYDGASVRERDVKTIEPGLPRFRISGRKALLAGFIFALIQLWRGLKVVPCFDFVSGLICPGILKRLAQ